jgi:hypothetical protein
VTFWDWVDKTKDLLTLGGMLLAVAVMVYW